jgi:aminoglycoside 6'-N-acetyltransferase I
MIIERCTSDSLEDWVKLRQVLWPDGTFEDLRREATDMLDRPRNAVAYLAREENGHTAAFAEATLRRDYVNGCSTSPVGFLEGIYVEAPWRRCGIARLLCRTLEDWAAGLGCTEFASDVLLHNEAGQRVHAALGFKEAERVAYFVKQLRRGN